MTAWKEPVSTDRAFSTEALAWWADAPDTAYVCSLDTARRMARELHALRVTVRERAA